MPTWVDRCRQVDLTVNLPDYSLGFLPADRDGRTGGDRQEPAACGLPSSHPLPSYLWLAYPQGGLGYPTPPLYLLPSHWLPPQLPPPLTLCQ